MTPDPPPSTIQPSIILHLGAPKCGARALQRALSASPDLPAADGLRLCYTALHPRGTGWVALSGRALRRAAAREVTGRLAWPEPDERDPAPLFAALDRVRRKAGGAVPVVSTPGWIGQADRFAAALPRWVDPETDNGGRIGLWAAVRPPLDWLNAAYWEWGIWSGHDFGSWLAQVGMPYTLGAALSRWAALPNTDLRLSLDDDACAGFDAAWGTALPRPGRGTAADLPPAFIGFLLRNGRYRDGPGDTAEEVFRRWCRVDGAPRPWAILPRHLGALRQATRADLDRLFALLPDTERDPRWTLDETAYAAAMLRGVSPLDDPEEMAQLYRALVNAVGAAAEAAGRRLPRLPPMLSTDAGVHAWDVAVARVLEHLVTLDAETRRRRRSFGL